MPSRAAAEANQEANRALTGELPLEIIRMEAKGCDVKLGGN